MRYWFLLSLFSLPFAACSSAPATHPDAAQIGVDMGSVDAAAVGADADAAPSNVVAVAAGADLQQAIDEAPDGAILQLEAGRYSATARAFDEQTCANCDDADFRQAIGATVGFEVRGKSVHIEGPAEAVIVTNAGYGMHFVNAGTSSVRGVTITGGVRDADGRATNAAIVVRGTTLEVREVHIVDNDDLYSGPEPDPVVGVSGIVVREGGDVTVVNTEILDTSWDGVAVYRGDPEVDGDSPRLTIEDSRIGCTRDCVSKSGRGVGIGVTWDGVARIVRTEVFGFWKGVGAFGTTKVELYNSIVRNQHGWGVVATGQSEMIAHNNVIIRNGTTGLAAWDPAARGEFVNNAIAFNGWNEDEWVGKRTGLWLNGDAFAVHHNAFWRNEPADSCRGGTPGQALCESIGVETADDNVVADPNFDGSDAHGLRPGSPLIDAGDPSILDPDGSRSDIGASGGPLAR